MMKEWLYGPENFPGLARNVERIANVFYSVQKKLSQQTLYSVNMESLWKVVASSVLEGVLVCGVVNLLCVFDSVKGEWEVRAARTVNVISAIKNLFGEKVELIHCLSLFQLQCCRKPLAN